MYKYEITFIGVENPLSGTAEAYLGMPNFKTEIIVGTLIVNGNYATILRWRGDSKMETDCVFATSLDKIIIRQLNDDEHHAEYFGEVRSQVCSQVHPVK